MFASDERDRGDDQSDAPNDSLWHLDFGVVGQGGLDVGSRTFYSIASVGNVGSPPIQLDEVEFPELEGGLRITRVGLYSESQPELAPGEDAIYVEVEVVEAGQWSIGPMYLTDNEAGETRRARISNEVGDACTTPIDETCMPWAS